MTNVNVQGWLYNGLNAQRNIAILEYQPDGSISYRLNQEDELTHICEVSELQISARIGNSARFISLPNQVKFETEHNDSVDQLIKIATEKGHIKKGLYHKLAYRLESNIYFVVLTIAILISSTWGFVQYGIPFLSKEVAMILPAEIAAEIGQGSLEIMDETVTQESELTLSRKEVLRLHFNSLIPEDENNIPLTLVFRKSEFIGPNAFALPSGNIIFTDEMIYLSENDDELKTIMLHEIGHVVHRHGLRQLFQQSGLAILILLISGDVSTTSAMILALPGVLLEAQYSQAMETEADTFALNRLAQHQLEAKHFAAIMSRMEGIQNDQNQALEVGDNQENADFSSYFSSHPATQERIQRFLDTPSALK